MNKNKIINDPIYGFVTIHHDIIFDCIELPEFQRLRRIKQLGLTSLVYPGAQHTRFQHAIGAMHLMQIALKNLRAKQVDISEKEEIAALLAILLHDIGHGPFSHTLEHSILDDVNHENISSHLMHQINAQMNGKLSLAIQIFENKYDRPFFHQLVSSQMDMDRLDYLRRDSFYTGVSEGTVGIERIIQMLNVRNKQLIIDQKGIYSIEKFLMARRFMYWQVYLHKTSIAADELLLNILKRAKALIDTQEMLKVSPYLQFFLENSFSKHDLSNPDVIENFCNLDDSEIYSAIKIWQNSNDKTLSKLCKMLINRDLLKIELFDSPISNIKINKKISETSKYLNISLSDASYFVSVGELKNNTYTSTGNSLKIGMKNGELKELSETSEIYNLTNHQKPQVKYYITSLKLD
ncbi:MAG: HD domain-containing protein [Bacteroidia bacterium]|nr:HD domain-containing protein [Bacteroidia bacterium]